MTTNDDKTQPSLLSQILDQALDIVAGDEHFEEPHVDGIRNLVDRSNLTDSRLTEVLLLEQKGGKREDHRD